ncbi:MAG TPA: hypothetical protein P5555_00785 [Candidatus Paceibacterota bacterium]|nr:hypothetical protein [Verrucomicrobiota bacterium]HRZ43708.1 hypothetical protein [Candidatus Paceibacterota bacterium]HRZ99322.1 hypothetical protein [Candidatus Paceibacterota bacterium]
MEIVLILVLFRALRPRKDRSGSMGVWNREPVKDRQDPDSRQSDQSGIGKQPSSNDLVSIPSTIQAPKKWMSYARDFPWSTKRTAADDKWKFSWM